MRIAAQRMDDSIILNSLLLEAHGLKQITRLICYGWNHSSHTYISHIDVIYAPFAWAAVIEVVFLCMRSSYASSNQDACEPLDDCSSAGTCPETVTAAAPPVKEPFSPPFSACRCHPRQSERLPSLPPFIPPISLAFFIAKHLSGHPLKIRPSLVAY